MQRAERSSPANAIVRLSSRWEASGVIWPVLSCMRMWEASSAGETLSSVLTLHVTQRLVN